MSKNKSMRIFERLYDLIELRLKQHRDISGDYVEGCRGELQLFKMKVDEFKESFEDKLTEFKKERIERAAEVSVENPDTAQVNYIKMLDYEIDILEEILDRNEGKLRT